MYIDNLRHYMDAVCCKRPVKWRTESWFLFYENDPAHRSILVKDFLPNNSVTTLEFPDLAAADF